VVPNSNTLKLTYFLAQYLYTKKQLDLPGIGSFYLDPSITIDQDSLKQKQPVEGISFKNNPALKDAADLILYISSESGKMKALAAADLDTHIQLALQFLNIGKPFSFEGIGTLSKTRSQEFEFIPGAVVTEKAKDVSVKDRQPISPKDNVDTKYQNYLADPVAKQHWKKPVVALLIICGIAITIWAGYTISNRNSTGGDESPDDAQATLTASVIDTIATDSITKPPVTSHSDNIRYILEVAQKKRAYKRYNQLRTNLWDVKLETNDSIQYKLVLSLPASNDTTRVLDSLMVMLGKRVYIEYPH
jgi:hypothetical protein